MLYGIGCDLCSLSHLEKSLSSAHAAAFVRRVYGPAEQAALGLLEGSAAPLNAHRLREPFSLCEIEAVRQENGAPAYRFSGQTAAWVAQHRLRARLSLSHEGGMALAFCTLEEES